MVSYAIVSWCSAYALDALPPVRLVFVSVFVPEVYRRQCATASVVTGGAEEARTPDPLLAKEVLSQLSYGPGIGRPEVGR